MTRLYIDHPLDDGLELDLPHDAAHHVRTVLRAAPASELTLFNGEGAVHAAHITALTGRRVTVLVGAPLAEITESPLEVTLVQSVSRGERMDYTVQKAVELGVQRIVAISTSRTVVRLDARRADKRLQHWRGVIRHAAEQSGRSRLPQLAGITPLDAWLSSPRTGTSWVLHPTAQSPLARMPAPAGDLTLVAGPEGGFDEREIDALTNAGVQGVALGPRVLRTETAAVCALSICQALWGDLG